MKKKLFEKLKKEKEFENTKLPSGITSKMESSYFTDEKYGIYMYIANPKDIDIKHSRRKATIDSGYFAFRRRS